MNNLKLTFQEFSCCAKVVWLQKIYFLHKNFIGKCAYFDLSVIVYLRKEKIRTSVQICSWVIYHKSLSLKNFVVLNKLYFAIIIIILHPILLIEFRLQYNSQLTVN